MPDERDPVDAHEFVLRAIANDESHYRPNHPQGPILRIAFGPTQQDTNGISFYRELFVPASKVAAALPRHGDYYIARLKARDWLD